MPISANCSTRTTWWRWQLHSMRPNILFIHLRLWLCVHLRLRICLCLHLRLCLCLLKLILVAHNCNCIQFQSDLFIISINLCLCLRPCLYLSLSLSLSLSLFVEDNSLCQYLPIVVQGQAADVSNCSQTEAMKWNQWQCSS